MVRGSAVRITGLDSRGRLPSPVPYAVSKSVARIVVSEVTETGGNEVLRGGDRDEPRLHFVKPDQTIRYDVDVDFLRVDPGVLSMVAGVPIVRDAAGDIIGFDATTTTKAASFALEVWSRLSGVACAGQREYGYTLFPFLKGGLLSGFAFANGLVSFNLRGARGRRSGRWGVGPWDISGPYQRLDPPVSGNTMFRPVRTTLAPPEPFAGVREFLDHIDGGTATMTSDDIIDGGGVETSPWIIEGGAA